MAGYKLAPKDSRQCFEPMTLQPKVKKVWQIIGTTLLLLVVGSLCLLLLWWLGYWIFSDVIKSPIGRAIVIPIFTALTAWIAWWYWRKSEAYQVTKAYIKAKKDKVCPIIEFK